MLYSALTNDLTQAIVWWRTECPWGKEPRPH